MATTYTPTIALRLPDDGDLPGTWGTNENNNLRMLEFELSRAVVLDITTATTTGYTYVVPLGTWYMGTGTAVGDTTPAEKHRCIYVSLTGALSEDHTLRVCGLDGTTPVDKFVYFKNDTTGGFDISFGNTTTGTVPLFGLKPGYGCLVQFEATGSLTHIITNSVHSSDGFIEDSEASNLTVSGLSSFATTFPVGTRNTIFGNNQGNVPHTLDASATDNSFFGYNTGLYAGSGALSNTLIGSHILEGIGSITNPTSSVVIGEGTGKLIATALTSSIIIGEGSCDSVGSVTESIIIGNDSATNVTSIDKSIVIGSLACNTSGAVPNGNIIVGYNALPNGTTGTNGISIGRQISAPLMTGNSNVMIGFDSLKLCTSGASNTVVGPESGSLISTGSTNIAVGSSALSAVTTGSNNIGIGTSAGSGTSSVRCISIGTSAGASASGTDSIAIGYLAKAGTTGSSNITIGNILGNAITSESRCVFIGNNLNSYVPPSSDYLAIASNTATPSIHGNIANGNYLIETNTNAGTMLHVKNTHATATNALIKVSSSNTTSNVVNLIEGITDGSTKLTVSNVGTIDSTNYGHAEKFTWYDGSAVDSGRIGKVVLLNFNLQGSGNQYDVIDYATSTWPSKSSVWTMGVVASSSSCAYIGSKDITNGECIIVKGRAWVADSDVTYINSALGMRLTGKTVTGFQEVII